MEIGSGLSEGDYCSLGWHEKDDLKVVVSHLRSNKLISCIGLWGRSMGSVTSLLYGAEDPSIAGMVLDSAFSNLYDLMMELVDVYKIRLPKFTVKMGVQYMRRVIEKRAKFDIMDLNCLRVAPKTFIPALFGHANDDQFIHPHHTDLISKAYAGDKNVIKFNGDHNSSRPQFFYDSVSLFFYNVLHPPTVPRARKLDKYYDLGNLKLGSAMEESILYEILSGLRVASTDGASSSSSTPNITNTASIGKLLSEVVSLTTAKSMVEDLTHGRDGHGHDDPKFFKDELNALNGDCYSRASSTRESWGRSSTLGHSDDESITDCRDDDIGSEIFVTPMGSLREMVDPNEDEKSQKSKKADTAKKLEKLGSLSRRLRRMLKGSAHRRHQSS